NLPNYVVIKQLSRILPIKFGLRVAVAVPFYPTEVSSYNRYPNIALIFHAQRWVLPPSVFENSFASTADQGRLLKWHKQLHNATTITCPHVEQGAAYQK